MTGRPSMLAGRLMLGCVRASTATAGPSVHVLDFDQGKLTPYIGPPVRRQDELKPQEIWTSPSGKTLVDFGQNLVGWLRLRVQGPAGTTITLRHAEVLEHDELGVRPLRTAEATDRFILSGGEDIFEPTFTFHGFRYAEVEGWPGGTCSSTGSGRTDCGRGQFGAGADR